MKKVYLLSLLIMVIILACAQIENNQAMQNVLAQADTITGKEVICGLTNSDAFRLGNSTWKDTAIIKYFIEYTEVVKGDKKITDYFNRSDKEYVTSKTARAMAAWEPHIGIPIIEVYSKSDANFLVQFKFLSDEGKGGMIALSDFPPVKDEYKNGSKRRITTVRMDLYDMWQYVKDRDKATYKYETVLLHELGHALSSLYHNSEYSIMNTNNKFKTIQIDDATAARTIYKKYDDFEFGGNRYTWITNTDKKYSLNFTNKELFTHCNNSNYYNGHFLSTKTIAGIQYIRTRYGCPVKILSSQRDVSCNYMVGGSKYSQHIFSNALDFKFIGSGSSKAKKSYLYDVRNRTSNLQALLLIGVKGFGSYPSGSFHIDSREVPVGNQSINGMQYIVWGLFRNVNKGAYQIHDEYTIYD